MSRIQNNNVVYYAKSRMSVQESVNFFQRLVKEQSGQKNAGQKKAVQKNAAANDASHENILKPGAYSVFYSGGFNQADKALLDMIYSGAVLPDGSAEAGRGYMGIAEKGEKLVPVKFMTHAKERYFGFKKDCQLMNEIDTGSQASEKAFASSLKLESKLLELAAKVNRQDVVADILRAYNTSAANDNHRSLLSRRVVFNALMAIKSGADSQGGKPLEFKFDAVLANSKGADASTSVKNRNWSGLTAVKKPGDEKNIETRYKDADDNREIRRQLGSIIAKSPSVTHGLQMMATRINTKAKENWTYNVDMKKGEYAKAKAGQSKKDAKLALEQIKAAKPKDLTVKDLEDHLVDVLMAHFSKDKNNSLDEFDVVLFNQNPPGGVSSDWWADASNKDMNGKALVVSLVRAIRLEGEKLVENLQNA